MLWHAMLIYVILSFGYMDEVFTRQKEATMCFWQKWFIIYFLIRIVRPIFLVLWCCDGRGKCSNCTIKFMERARCSHQVY